MGRKRQGKGQWSGVWGQEGKDSGQGRDSGRGSGVGGQEGTVVWGRGSGVRGQKGKDSGQEMDDKGLMDAFFDEAAFYQRDFTESCRKILGESWFEEVEVMREKLKEFGSHISEPERFEGL